MRVTDYSYSDSEEEVSEEEESSVVSVLDFGFMEFGSFHCDVVPIKPLKPIKLEIKGSTIKIGEIPCFLVSEITREPKELIIDLLKKHRTEQRRCDLSKKIQNRKSEPLAKTQMALDSGLDHRVSGVDIVFAPPFWHDVSAVSVVSFSVSRSCADLIFTASDPDHLTLIELGILVSVIDVPSTEKIVELNNIVSSPPPRRSAFGFDPCGSLATAYNSALCRLPHNRRLQTSHSRLQVLPPSFSPIMALPLSFATAPPHRSFFVFDPGGTHKAVSNSETYSCRSTFVFDPDGRRCHSLFDLRRHAQCLASLRFKLGKGRGELLNLEASLCFCMFWAGPFSIAFFFFRL